MKQARFWVNLNRRTDDTTPSAANSCFRWLAGPQRNWIAYWLSQPWGTIELRNGLIGYLMRPPVVIQKMWLQTKNRMLLWLFIEHFFVTQKRLNVGCSESQNMAIRGGVTFSEKDLHQISVPLVLSIPRCFCHFPSGEWKFLCQLCPPTNFFSNVPPRYTPD